MRAARALHGFLVEALPYELAQVEERIEAAAVRADRRHPGGARQHLAVVPVGPLPGGEVRRLGIDEHPIEIEDVLHERDGQSPYRVHLIHRQIEDELRRVGVSIDEDSTLELAIDTEIIDRGTPDSGPTLGSVEGSSMSRATPRSWAVRVARRAAS